MYQPENEVFAEKLGEGPNRISQQSDASRICCFPLYTILLAYNSTTLDYLSLDSKESEDELVR